MDQMISTVSYLLAGVCAAVMGFAIQRGATCTVAAVEEVFHDGSVLRLVALVEASAWVSGGLLIASHLGWVMALPYGYAWSAWTIVGAASLGVGAYVNGGCVFGAVARFGSGEWAYAATPVGFYLGCLAASHVFVVTPRALPPGSFFLEAPPVLVWLTGAFFAWRVVMPLVAHRRSLRALVTRHLWTPHAATTVIGITFLATLLLVGAWTYTDILADIARGMAHAVEARSLLLLCLLGGAVFSGWSAGLWRHRTIGGASLLRCVVGGLLMGWGSAFIVGGNDGLILLGMPLFWPYAWIAFVTMCVSIGAALWVHKRVEAVAMST